MGFGGLYWHVKNMLPKIKMKNSTGINAVNEKRKLNRSEMHRDQKPRNWRAFHPLIFWAKCIPQIFTAVVPGDCHDLTLAAGHQSGACDGPPAQICHIPNSQVPGAYPVSVLFFLSLMSSPFCATKTWLSILEAHFSVPYPPSHFFLLGFPQATGHGKS